MTESSPINDNVSSAIDYTTPAPRFSVTDASALDKAMAYLNEHGYVVISDLMNDEEIQANKDLLWNFLETVSNHAIQRHDPDTWNDQWPSFSTHGVISHSGIGQSDFLWSVRSNPQVKKVFARIWNTDQLLVSFDGCGVFRDWRYNPVWKTDGGWNHVDQNPRTKPDRCCIQGFVSLTDQDQSTGGLIVYPQSHLRFHELTDLVKETSTSDFAKVPNTHPIMNQGQTMGKLVHCRAGDLVLWDSRTIHCNSPAVAINERNKGEPVELLRIVAYVNMAPPSFVRAHTLKDFRAKRREFVENSSTTTHWSTELTLHKGAETDLPKTSLDKFNDYQKALIFGF